MWLWLLAVLVAIRLLVGIMGWLGDSHTRDAVSCGTNHRPAICKLVPGAPIPELSEHQLALPTLRVARAVALPYAIRGHVTSVATMPFVIVNGVKAE